MMHFDTAPLRSVIQMVLRVNMIFRYETDRWPMSFENKSSGEMAMKSQTVVVFGDVVAW